MDVQITCKDRVLFTAGKIIANSSQQILIRFQARNSFYRAGQLRSFFKISLSTMILRADIMYFRSLPDVVLSKG